MVIDFTTKIDRHLDILPRKTKKAFEILSQQNWLKRSGWYLAGGTALALQAGHRSSLDLYFFLPKTDFKINSVLKHFSKLDWKTKIAKEGTIYGELLEVKVSFIAYPFFVSQCCPLWYSNLRILAARDIAVMKIIAISQRGRKRAFFDLYWYVKHREPLEEIFNRLDVQYPTVEHNYHHILKSLNYFADAENDPTPKIFFQASWREVKIFFRKEAVRLSKKLVGLR